MPDQRRDQIIRLLETRDDHLPTPTRREMPGRAAGFVHNQTARESCPDCLANDRVLKTCETCKGRGYTEVQRTHDPYAKTDTLPYGFDRTTLDRQRELDSQIARLQHQTRPSFATHEDEIADANQHPYPWEIARRRMYRQYDYAHLDHALDELRHTDEGAYHALHAAYIYGWAEPSAGYQHAVNRGLDHLEHVLPDPLRAPSSPVHPALERRAKRAAA
jgi:hypothetical protein